MPKIHLLDEALINKIAAGEVIENPASVVKELLENSIDAGSTNIEIELREAGKSYIKITDNGAGMDSEDALLSFERHATSKIRHAEDLFNISTLGFRGEALASIAAVSNLKITTKTAKCIEGFYIEVEAGKIIKTEKAGCPKGTTIEVSHLFFNTPARKKYLQGTVSELNKAIDIVTRYALINTEVSFKLIHEDKVILLSPKSGKLLDKIISIYGKETAKQMIEISKKGILSLKGYISKPSLTRSDKSQESVFVNGRYVKSDIISDAVYDAYKTLLFHGRHPVFSLILEINPKDIDVNVHPSKKTIKISREKEIYDFVYQAVKGAMNKESLVPETLIKPAYARPQKSYSVETGRQEVLAIKEAAKGEYSEKSEIGDKESAIGPMKIIGQINKTYILAENSHGLAIIDQHAAEERIIYEGFMEKYKNKGIKRQSLIKPINIELSVAESNLLSENIAAFNSLGFEIEEYGKNSFLIRSVPYIFERFDKNLIMDLLAELGNLKSKSVDEKKEERIIRLSCRKAVKAGLELTGKQMEELIGRLKRTKTPYTCPHGRPTIISISLSELERKFKRTG